ncbi:MAG: crotonase/enoyl-CoA hydratase family protein [Myxococcota bacterium]
MSEARELVNYELRGDVALLNFDDGKANVISPDSTAALNSALDRAEKEAKALVIAGRAGRFSAGFDLSVMKQGGAAVVEMISGGAALVSRLYGFPVPTVAAVTGHALAMGAVLLMSIDERIAAQGAFKIGLNEAAIGMSLPTFALILARDRLTPSHLIRATANAEIYAPEAAVDAGFVDRVVDAERVVDEAVARAQELSALDTGSHHAIKSALRAEALAALRESIGEVR